MRLLVVSDTHGQAPLATIARIALGCDLVIHLGDGFQDGQKLTLMQDRPVIQVLGNVDLPLDVVPDKLIEIESWTILLTHGHLYGVKHSLAPLFERASEVDADLALFGHAHRRIYHQQGKVKAFCPSSAAYAYDGTAACVGIVDLSPAGIAHQWIELPANPG